MKQFSILIIIFSVLIFWASIVNAIPNPAPIYCTEMGYIVDGNDCDFGDGNKCELSAFYRGECGQGYVKDLACAASGESLKPGHRCCEGLIGISRAIYAAGIEQGGVESASKCAHIVGAWPICAPCGNGTCEEQWENQCNCLQDCGCYSEGQIFDLSQNPNAKCCQGLEAKSQYDLRTCIALPGMKFVCVNCGDGNCGLGENKCNCPQDCPEKCAEEGETIPVVPNPPKCCNGLVLIPPKASNILGISGICTAKCGNRICDSDTETSYNCPQDCIKKKPVCGNRICEEGEADVVECHCPISADENRCLRPCMPKAGSCPTDCKKPPSIEKESIETEIITEKDEEPVPISIKGSADKTITVKTKESEAVTSEKIVIQESKLYMEVNDKKKSEIKVLPEEASAKAVEAVGKGQVDKIELKQEAEKPVYSVRVIKKAKLFRLIPITMRIETKVDAETGDVLSVKKPWWSFFVW